MEKKFSRITSEEAGKLKADPLFVEAIKMPTRTDAQLTALLRRLAEKGYVSKGDFGWMSPAWVSEAFDDTLKVNAACVAPDA